MRRYAQALALAAAASLGISPTVQANPAEGEARSILRDADRVYSVVAGEGDGTSTVTNPANLGYLEGINGVLDFSYTARRARRRGSGVGAFIGIPVPFDLAAFGLGYQLLLPLQPDSVDQGDEEPQGPDDPYSKISLALAVPFQRWVPGLSIGLSYSRLVAGTNFHANANQLDLAVSYWPARFVALGLVGRALNVPRTGDADGRVVQPLVVDPEIAFRPFGTPVFELAGGLRYAPRVPADARFRTWFLEPRARLMSSFGGVRLFAEVERMRFNPDPVMGLEPRDGVRLSGGVEVSFGHVAFAGAPLLSAGTGSDFAADGGAARLRITQERYPTVAVSPRLVTRLRLASYRGDRGMWKAVNEIDAIADRGGVLLVETRGMSYGWAQTEEIREALMRVRDRGGKVIVYMEGASLRSYFLASAADRIIAHPNIKLGVIGMRIEALYYADLLAKLGAKAQFVRMAEYKSTPERYERSGPTDPSAKQRLMLVSDTWNHALRLIARERGHEPRVIKEWIDRAPIVPDDAVGLGMIDELAYRDELDARLEAWLDRKIRIEEPDARKWHRNRYGPPPRVAVLFVEGDIVRGDSFTVPIIGRKIAGSNTLTKQIERLRKDTSVRAVVVRCNTPGGSVTGADAIARELDLTRKVKPVVISMSNACASGGYWITTAAQYVFADAMTVTGAIGVFQVGFDLSGTAEMLGLGVDDFDLGANAGMWSIWKPHSESERKAIERKVGHDYTVFTDRVAKARSMSTEQVDGVARGRVWSGVRGTEVGIVDAYGGLREAVIRARAIAGMPTGSGEVALYPPPPTVLDNVRAILGFRIPNPLSSGEGTRGRFGVRAAAAGGGALAVLPRPVIEVLRRLPVALWLGDAPESLALMESSIEIVD